MNRSGKDALAILWGVFAAVCSTTDCEPPQFFCNVHTIKIASLSSPFM